MADFRLIDSPVLTKQDESLGVGMYADILANFISGCETPITIGIQGDWGIGKTSMLNMVKENLAPTVRSKYQYHVIYFNTWQYSQFQQEQFLGLSILKGIMAEVQNLESLKDLRKGEEFKTAFKKFGKFVGELGNQVVHKKTGMDLKGAASGQEESSFLDNDIVVQIRQMKDEFSDLVKVLVPNERDRLVIMIDDLDRIKPVRALEFLEAIKNFLDVEKCVFVMAVDYSVIQTGMIEKLGRSAQELQGKSYFDKIIQVPFTMPSGSYQTDKYVLSLLGWNYQADDGGSYVRIEEDRERFFLASCRAKNINKSVVDFFSNITALTVGNNPRSIKRAVNYANLLRMVVQSQWRTKPSSDKRKEWQVENAMMLYPLACMQLAWPELFEHFANEPNPSTLASMQDFDYLQQLQGMDALFKRVHNPEETKSNITGFIDEFISLVDVNGDGQVSMTEFSPIWQMMIDSNMTSAKYKNIDDDWQKLKDIIFSHMGDKRDSELVERVFRLFRHEESSWSDLRNFDLLSAGKKFYNVTWAKKQIGSIVSTQKQPLQFFLKGDYQLYCGTVANETKSFLADVKNIGHYGTGDTRVEIVDIAMKQDGLQIINSIFDAMQKQISQGTI
jgi:predicted transport protein